MHWTEILGYAASVLIAVSLMMSSLVRLRWLNLAGAILFSTYGFVIGALPVAFLNGFIALTNIYFLYGIYRKPQQFHLLNARHDDPLIRHWLIYYQDAIEEHFMHSDPGELNDPRCFLLIRNSETVGFIIGAVVNDCFELAIDYVFPAFQDFKTGRFLYHRSRLFEALGVQRILVRSQSPRYQTYLRRMGFTACTSSDEAFEFVPPQPENNGTT